jgi:CHAT domain-containing protein
VTSRIAFSSSQNASAGIAPVFSDKDEVDNAAPEKRSVEIRNQFYSSLPYTEKEVEEISKLFYDKNMPAKTFTHSRATEKLIKSDSLKKYNIIHIATHGFIDEENPKLSGIVFWGDERRNEEDAVLHIGEIFNLDLESKLLVLSACESGLGKYVRGEGIIGMTRGFIYAGAENIVISLWQVADRSTAELMVDFYSNILNGNNYSSSLRRAKLKMIKEKKYAYPLEWSPFIIVSH